MAIRDAKFIFSDEQAITVDALSTNVLDWGEGMEDLDIGEGTPSYVNIMVTTTFDGGTDLTISLYTHTTTTVNSGTVLLTTQTFAQASLTAGAILLSVSLPPNADRDRYFGIYYDQTDDFTAGKVSAWFGHEPIAQLSPATQVAVSNV